MTFGEEIAFGEEMAFGGSLSSMTSEPAFGQIHMVRGTRHFPRLMVGCPVGWGDNEGG